jgi:multiple sugar transport system ATP-binding protein
MAGVILERVSRVYPGGVKAVDDISLEVADQEFVVLVGPSGCGKSTTLRLIAGLEELSGGTIRIGGRLVNDVAPKDRDIAMVFQNYALYPHMSVYKNMAFGLQLRYGGNWIKRVWWRATQPARAREMALHRRQIADRVRQTAQGLGIEPLLARLPGQLSGGERQRVALGRAIVRQPAAFLFDEPLSNLDAKLRVDMRREVKQLHGRLAATMIYVTHDQVEAMTLGDRIVVLDQGRVQQVGTPLEIYDRPRNRFVAGFIGTPAMNFCEGRLAVGRPIAGGNGVRNEAATAAGAESKQATQTSTAGGTRRLWFVARGWSAPVDAETGRELAAFVDREVVLGIRPEDVWLGEDAAASPVEERIEARVALVEPLGDAQIVHLALCTTAGPAVGADRDAIGRTHLGRGLGGCGVGSSDGEPLLVCKSDPRRLLAAGQCVAAWLDLRRAHWFDPATGESVRGSRQ